MMKFGEKIRQLREEKGMTQQEMAGKLYVTRQAVSRWECGARYPDLLTAKKIAQIFQVTTDELLSGEELKPDIEKGSVLAQPLENGIRTVLYTIAAAAFLIMSILGVYSLFSEALAAGDGHGTVFSWLGFFTVGGYVIKFLAVSYGLQLSVRNKLTAKIAGSIMCLPYVTAALLFLVTVIDMQIRQNGRITIGGWISDFFMPLMFALCVWLFFAMRKRWRPLLWVIFLICILNGGYIAFVVRRSFLWITDLGFAVRTVHCLGKIGMVLLLGYQAYIWDRKRAVAYKNESKRCEGVRRV